MNDSQLLLYHQQLHASNSYLGRHDNTLPGPGYHFYNDSKYLYSHPITPGREKPQPFVLHMVGRVSAQANFMSLKKSISSLLIPNTATDKIKINSLRRSALLGRARAGPFPQDWAPAISKLKELTKLLTKSNTDPSRNLWFNDGGNVDDTHVKFGAPCFKARGYGEPADDRLADLVSPHQQSNARWTQAAPYITMLDFNLIDHTGTTITESMLPEALNGATVDIAFVLRGWKFGQEKYWSFALDVQQVVVLRPEQNDDVLPNQMYNVVTPPRRSSTYHPPTPVTPSNVNSPLNNTYPSENLYASSNGSSNFGSPSNQLRAPFAKGNSAFGKTFIGNSHSDHFAGRTTGSTFDASIAAGHGALFNPSRSTFGTPLPTHRELPMQHDRPPRPLASVYPSVSPFGILKADCSGSSVVALPAENTVPPSMPYAQEQPLANKGFLPNVTENNFEHVDPGRTLLQHSDFDQPVPHHQNGALPTTFDHDFETRLMNAVNIARMQHLSQSLIDPRISRQDHVDSVHRGDLQSPFALKDRSGDHSFEVQVIAEEFKYMNDMSSSVPNETPTQSTVVMPKFNWDDGLSDSAITKDNAGNVFSDTDKSPSVQAGERPHVTDFTSSPSGNNNADVSTKLVQSTNVLLRHRIILPTQHRELTKVNTVFVCCNVCLAYPPPPPPLYPVSNTADKSGGKGKKRAVPEDVGPSVPAKAAKIDTDSQRRAPVPTAV
ncbi:hypothetical protein GG344DRAFT_74017 [Lentinula edodes]|nr:hypothetical protein GG344DRAFT_74017 [Lentinula edodes]